MNDMRDTTASKNTKVDNSKTVPMGMPTTFPYWSEEPMWKYCIGHITNG